MRPDAVSRKHDTETTTPKPKPRLQGEGGGCCCEGGKTPAAQFYVRAHATKTWLDHFLEGLLGSSAKESRKRHYRMIWKNSTWRWGSRGSWMLLCRRSPQCRST